jgi:hypothetical protein
MKILEQSDILTDLLITFKFAVLQPHPLPLQLAYAITQLKLMFQAVIDIITILLQNVVPLTVAQIKILTLSTLAARLHRHLHLLFLTHHLLHLHLSFLILHHLHHLLFPTRLHLHLPSFLIHLHHLPLSSPILHHLLHLLFPIHHLHLRLSFRIHLHHHLHHVADVL